MRLYALILTVAFTLLVLGCSGNSETIDVPDPMVQNTTDVSFEITVPTYQSNELQVRLKWGNADITANWIGDQFWSTTTELPTNTEHLMIVTFLDRNGAIILGSYETFYLTGINASEIIRIEADDFITETFDDDNDGVSNLSESIAGTDPLVENNAVLEVHESLDEIDSLQRVFSPNVLRVVRLLESRVPDERPYEEYFIEQQPEVYDFTENSTTIEQSIDLDEFGSGSIAYSRTFIGAGRSSDQLVEISGTRSNQEGVITWLGSYSLNSVSAALRETDDFNITTTVINDRIRAQIGMVEMTANSSTHEPPKLLATFELSGDIIDGSKLCSPDSGSVNLSVFYYQASIESDVPDSTHTMNKEPGDQYWTYRSGDEQYWVESIGDFYCVFKDQ